MPAVFASSLLCTFFFPNASVPEISPLTVPKVTLKALTYALPRPLKNFYATTSNGSGGGEEDEGKSSPPVLSCHRIRTVRSGKHLACQRGRKPVASRTELQRPNHVQWKRQTRCVTHPAYSRYRYTAEWACMAVVVLPERTKNFALAFNVHLATCSSHKRETSWLS